MQLLSTPKASTRERAQAAMRMLFVGDSLAMPVHWYYRPSDILQEYAPSGIDRLHPAPKTHPGAIMSLHSTERGGRKQGNSGAAAGQSIVGDVILKGRRHLWDCDGTHYHSGLPAGENTLNAWCTRWLMQDLAQHGTYDPDRWLATYIDRMTDDPPAHPDTYAESYHRGFFANLQRGKTPCKCAASTHDTASIGALVTVAPLALALLPDRPLADVQRTCRNHVALTHPDPQVAGVVDAYVRLIAELLRGEEDRDIYCGAAAASTSISVAALLEKEIPVQKVIGHIFSPACYLDGSWPAVCWLAARYQGKTPEALIANTNAGGDNVHRGAVLGVLLGLANPDATPWWDALHRHEELETDLDAWLARYYP